MCWFVWGCLGLLQKAAVERQSGLGLEAERGERQKCQRSGKRRRGMGEVLTCPTWLSLRRRKTGTLGRVPVYLEGGSLAQRDLLNRSCCSCWKCRDFYCPNSVWQREREWSHVYSWRLRKERCSGDYDLFLVLLRLLLCGSIPQKLGCGQNIIQIQCWLSVMWKTRLFISLLYI